MAAEHELLIKGLVIPLRERGLLEFIARKCNDYGEWILDYTELAVAMGHTSDVSTRQMIFRIEKSSGVIKRRQIFVAGLGQQRNILFFDSKQVAETYERNPLANVLDQKKALIAQQYRTAPPHEHVMTPPHEHVMTPPHEHVMTPPNSGPIRNMHARAGSGVLIHELNMNELNSTEKFSTAPPIDPRIADHNAKKADAFKLSAQLLKWAERECPLVPVELTTALWRERVKQMQDRLEKPVAHWRSFLNKAQKWRADEEAEKAGLYVGVNGNENGQPVRPAETQTQGAMPDGTELTDASACEWVQAFAADGLHAQIQQLLEGTYPFTRAPAEGQWRALAEEALKQAELKTAA